MGCMSACHGTGRGGRAETEQGLTTQLHTCRHRLDNTRTFLEHSAGMLLQQTHSEHADGLLALLSQQLLDIFFGVFATQSNGICCDTLYTV